MTRLRTVSLLVIGGAGWLGALACKGRSLATKTAVPTARELLAAAELKVPRGMYLAGRLQLDVTGPGGGTWVFDFDAHPPAVRPDATATCTATLTNDDFVQLARQITTPAELGKAGRLHFTAPGGAMLGLPDACVGPAIQFDGAIESMFGVISPSIRSLCAHRLERCASAPDVGVTGCEIPLGRRNQDVQAKGCGAELDALLSCLARADAPCDAGLLPRSEMCDGAWKEYSRCAP